MSVETLTWERDRLLTKLKLPGKSAQGAENEYAAVHDKIVLERHKAGETGVIRLRQKWRGRR